MEWSVFVCSGSSPHTHTHTQAQASSASKHQGKFVNFVAASCTQTAMHMMKFRIETNNSQKLSKVEHLTSEIDRREKQWKMVFRHRPQHLNNVGWGNENGKEIERIVVPRKRYTPDAFTQNINSAISHAMWMRSIPSHTSNRYFNTFLPFHGSILYILYCCLRWFWGFHVK